MQLGSLNVCSKLSPETHLFRIKRSKVQVTRHKNSAGAGLCFKSVQHQVRFRHRKRALAAAVCSDVSSCCSDIWRVIWSRCSVDMMCRSIASRRSAQNTRTV